MNGATFRAYREITGMSQRTVAEALDVTETAVKNWERGLRSVPKQVSDWLWDRVAEHDDAVEQSMEGFEAMADELDGEPAIVMNYWRTQDEYDAFGRDDGDVGRVNARARAMAQKLREEGYTVTFENPAEAPYEFGRAEASR